MSKLVHKQKTLIIPVPRNTGEMMGRIPRGYAVIAYQRYSKRSVRMFLRRRRN